MSRIWSGIKQLSASNFAIAWTECQTAIYPMTVNTYTTQPSARNVVKTLSSGLEVWGWESSLTAVFGMKYIFPRDAIDRYLERRHDLWEYMLELKCD